MFLTERKNLKNMKIFRKILSISCLLIVSLSLIACGASGNTETEVDSDAVYATARGVISIYDSIRPESYEQVSAFSEDEMENVVAMLSQQGLNISAEAFKNGFESYLSSKEDLGDIQDISDLRELSFARNFQRSFVYYTLSAESQQ